MVIGNRVGTRPALLLAAAALGAGLMAGPWGAPVRAEARALTESGTVAPRLPGVTIPRPVPVAVGAPAPSAPDPQSAVSAALARMAAGRAADSVSVAALDATTGTRVAWGATSGMTTASVFKLSLLESYLLHNQDRGQEPGEGQEAALAAMVENSDNDSADAVYEALGGAAGVNAAIHRLGLSSTVLGSDDHWGLSTTSAGDQLTVLENLASPTSPLSAASRAYALGLASNVEADQRWGVGAAADPGTDFANKNGWLNVDDDGGRWVVGSVGVIQAHGHQILLAVLTQHDSDLDSGISFVESVARTVTTTLTLPGQGAGTG